jgi:hypothetical protein
MLSLLSKLVGAPSISGSEQSIREVMQKELKPYVDEMKVDKIGNLIARKGKGSPKILLAAHMDALGLMVKYIDKDGFISFETIGGWDERILPGIKVQIHGSKGPVTGVLGTKAVHLQEKDEQKIPYKLKELFIDIGANSIGDRHRRLRNPQRGSKQAPGLKGHWSGLRQQGRLRGTYRNHEEAQGIQGDCLRVRHCAGGDRAHRSERHDIRDRA